MRSTFVTGATGFVGSAIVLELLDRTDYEIYALVRETASVAPQLRLQETLLATARGFGRADLEREIQTRVHTVAGDLTDEHLAEKWSAEKSIDSFWHCAASLRFEDTHRDEITQHNILGTRNALALARAIGVARFNYISTAYVAGSRTGLIHEDSAPDEANCNNFYEVSKVRAEQIVREHGSEFQIRIMRPSVVIGHSRTLHAFNWSGMYGFARQMLVFRNAAYARLGTFISHARVQLIADPDCTINLVPVDMVARSAIDIGLSDSEHRTFHLVNGTDALVGSAIRAITDLLQMREPKWVSDDEGFTSLDRLLDNGLVFYRSYLRNPKKFSTSNGQSVAEYSHSGLELPQAEVSRYVSRFLETVPSFKKRTPPARELQVAVQRQDPSFAAN